MPTIRSLTNGNKLTDWTNEVNEIANQYGLLNGTGLFNTRGVAQTSITFDINTVQNSLLPQVNRKARETYKGADRKLETYAIPLPYFNVSDMITPDDLQGHRDAGTPDGARTLASAVADKLTDVRVNADQTTEYMKVQAIKGLTKDPEGTTLADMFTMLGVTQKTIDFDLDTSTTEVELKVDELKAYVAKNARVGGAIGRIECLVSPSFFNKLVTHAKVRLAYQYFAGTGVQLLREDLAEYKSWGIVNSFEYKGVLFSSYDAEFILPDETTEVAFTADEGYSLVRGLRDVYRGYTGPANTLSGANSVGKDMFVYQYTDPKDKFHEIELEMSPLFFMTKPQVSVKVFT